MADSGIKIKYSARLLRLRIEVAMARFAASAEPPPEALERCRRKMSQLQAAGIVQRFEVYEAQFHRAWAAFHRRAPEPDTDPLYVGITVACGQPHLQGLALAIPAEAGAPPMLTLAAEAHLLTWWQPEWLQVWVTAEAGLAGLTFTPELACVHALLVRAAHGDSPVSVPLRPARVAPEGPAEPTIRIVADAALGEISVVVNGVGVAAEPAREAILASVRQAIKVLRRQGVGRTVLLKGALRSRLALLGRSPAAFGLDLPVRYLAAVALGRTAESTAALAAAANDAAPWDQAPDGPARPAPAPVPVPASPVAQPVVPPSLPIVLTEGGAAATVGVVDGPALLRGGFAPTEAWLRGELTRHGVIFGVDTAKVQAALALLVSGGAATGRVLAVGQVPVPATDPYLHLVYLDGPGGASPEGGAPRDLREAQRRGFVRQGEVIAEVRYKQPGSPGVDVRGRTLAATGPTLPLTLGAGVARLAGGHYVATADGAPRLEDGKLVLDPVYSHVGDVNLTSGHIRFAGAVEILGSIEAGAVVDVAGDLLVHGSVYSTGVRCGGNMVVVGGIVSGLVGTVRVKGTLTAGFVNNSRVACAGDVAVAKSILASVVIAGGKLTVAGTPDALVAGGSVSCAGDLLATNVGREAGTVTTLNVGVDWRAALSAELRQARQARVAAQLGEVRKNLEALVARTPAQLAKKVRQRREALKAWVAKAEALLPKLRAHAAKAKDSAKVHGDARLLVTNLMSANLALHVGGKAIATPQELLGVAVSGRRDPPFSALVEAAGDEPAKAS